jgi:hypothetical protein
LALNKGENPGRRAKMKTTKTGKTATEMTSDKIITVIIAHEEPDDVVARVAAALESSTLTEYSFRWNGAHVSIERGEHTCIVCDDEIAGTQLLHSVVIPALHDEGDCEA